MATSIKSIISQAHQLANITSREFSEEPDGIQSAMALIDLNNILQQLNEDQLFPFSSVVATHQIVTPKEYYTIGLDLDNPSNLADIQSERPVYIGNILYRNNSQATPYRILPVTLDEVRANLIKTSTGAPRYFAINKTWPFLEIYFSMKPKAGDLIEIIYNKSLPLYGINDKLELPYSYVDLLVVALARRIAVNANEGLIGKINTMYHEAINRVRTANTRSQVPLFNMFEFNDSDFGWSRMESGRELWP